MKNDSEPKSESPRLGWTYVPLIAYAIIVLGLMLFFAYESGPRPEWISPLDYYETLIFVFVLIALAHSALIGLFAVTHKKAKNDWPNIGSVRAAMWSSLIAMFVPYALAILFVCGSVLELGGQHGGGEAGGILIFFGLFAFIFVLPIFGMWGWGAGLRIHTGLHIRRRLKHFVSTVPAAIFVGPIIFFLFLSVLVVGRLMSIR